jgi:hypothetical protein
MPSDQEREWMERDLSALAELRRRAYDEKVSQMEAYAWGPRPKSEGIPEFMVGGSAPTNPAVERARRWLRGVPSRGTLKFHGVPMEDFSHDDLLLLVNYLAGKVFDQSSFHQESDVEPAPECPVCGPDGPFEFREGGCENPEPPEGDRLTDFFFGGK